jgi:RNA polymerase sigma-70 factor (ECF subfamily)
MTDALGESRPQAAGFNFDEFFRTHYPPAARTIARVTGDAARAEDLAAEALWKLWRNPGAHGESAAGWLYRTAIRLALNELRGRERRRKYELLSPAGRAVATPEQVHAAAEEREQVRCTLTALEPRDAEMLLLQASGLRYQEIARALEINPASVGTMLARAQRAFRKEYAKRYGEQQDGR